MVLSNEKEGDVDGATVLPDVMPKLNDASWKRPGSLNFGNRGLVDCVLLANDMPRRLA